MTQDDTPQTFFQFITQSLGNLPDSGDARIDALLKEYREAHPDIRATEDQLRQAIARVLRRIDREKERERKRKN